MIGALKERFIFRQVDYRDLPTFLHDGEIRAKNHHTPQLCHQTSYQEIVERRNTSAFQMPCGGVVNDYVPFYFSPLTSFTYTIHQGNVRVVSPQGIFLGQSCSEDRVFLVCKTSRVSQEALQFCYSNAALNSGEGLVELNEDFAELENHVNWDVFDDPPMRGHIPEIGFHGVCQYFMNSTNVRYQNRSKERMAEFLVRGSQPLEMIECIVTKDPVKGAIIQSQLDDYQITIPVFVNSGCYF